MKIEIWGPATWNFFHTIAEKIKEEHFNIIGPQLFLIIRRICLNLPCPDCSQHANAFLNRVNFSKIHSKDEFKNMLCFFHNEVNKKKENPYILVANWLFMQITIWSMCLIVLLSPTKPRET